MSTLLGASVLPEAGQRNADQLPRYAAGSRFDGSFAGDVAPAPTRAGCTSASEGASERDDPMNALLDAFEGTVRALIDNGLEVQLRARLERLLPAPVKETARSLDGASVAHQQPRGIITNIDRALTLANAASVLAAVERRQRLDASRRQLAAARAVLELEIESLRGTT